MSDEVGEDGVVAAEEEHGCQEPVVDLENGGQVDGVDATMSTGVLDDNVDAADGLFCFVDFLEELFDIVAER